MVKYTLADFTAIKNNGFDFQLSPQVITTLRDLHRQFKPNVEVIRQLNFRRTKLDFSKPTTIVSEENKVNPFTTLRLLLNKVSPKNYLDCVEKLENIVENFVEEEDFSKLAELLFELASTNRFYTSLYADLFSHLVLRATISEGTSASASTATATATATATTSISSLSTNVYYRQYERIYGSFLERFDHLVYVDPNTDYDQFCAMNVENEKRKALSTFFVCLMKNGIAPKEHSETMLRTLLEKTETLIAEPSKVNEVDEIVENINCIYSPPHHHDLFNPKLQQLSTLKYKQFPSLSSKTLFKLQDIAKKPKTPISPTTPTTSATTSVSALSFSSSSTNRKAK
jgi:hypothetical protein